MNRDITFDIFKGIGIILMVIAHAAFPGKSFICLFHMAIFFICSGVFFKEKSYENIKNLIKSIKSKLKHLYIPFILWNGFLTMIHNYLIKINIYTNNDDFLLLPCGSSFGLIDSYTVTQVFNKLLSTLIFSHGEQLGGATWFLRVLFWISIATLIGHYIFSKIIKNKTLFSYSRLIIYIFALIIGYIMQKVGFKFYNIEVMFSCSILYYFGILYSMFKEKIKINFIFFAISYIVLIISDYFIGGEVSLSVNKYPNPIWFMIVSISGFFFMLSISKFISKFQSLSKIMSYIGRHTMSILLFHLAVFKIITYIHIKIFNEPSYYLAAFPVLLKSDYWWILYGLTGVILPLLMVFLWDSLKMNILKYNNR